MSKTEFKPAKHGTKVYFSCPRCHNKTKVSNFELEPVLTGNGKFTETWFLKVYGVCGKCECCGTRAVGTFKAKGTGRLHK